MYQLNNFDVIILIIVAISALIALNRGLIKEVLSIVGWVLATMCIIYLLPICLPFAKKFTSSGIIAGVISTLSIFVLFFIIWIYSTGSIIGSIRTSKLNGLDRFLGLFFGIMRAFLLIVLFYIMTSWIVPVDRQPETLAKSKYYQLAGSFAKPLENMIPEETLKIIKERTIAFSEPENSSDEKQPKSANSDDEAIILFEKLAQPKIKNTIKEQTAKVKEEIKGYKETERNDLDRLIDSVD